MLRPILLLTTFTVLLPLARAQQSAPLPGPDKTAISYVRSGIAKLQDQQWDAAIADFTEAIRIDPNAAIGYSERGRAYQSLGRFDEAIADYSDLIGKHPGFSSAYFERGSVYLMTHKPELALADAEEEIRRKPEERMGYTLRARARLQLGDQAGAEEDKAKAAELKAQAQGSEMARNANTALRIGGEVVAANLIHKVVPEYPVLAKEARVQGVVRFSVVIGKDGAVESLQLISGHPVLVEAARTAVRQWQYKPTLLNGDPVRVATTVDVTFTLQE